jgi:hypothetical protein
MKKYRNHHRRTARDRGRFPIFGSLGRSRYFSSRYSRGMQILKDTGFVDTLENKGFIARKKDINNDARELAIYPTKKSEKIARDLEAKGEELFQKTVKSIGKSELADLVIQLRNIEKDLR